MPRLWAKVSRSEVMSITKNRPHTFFLGLIGYMVRSGAKLFRTKTLLNFTTKALPNSFFQKTRFRFELLYQIAPHLFYGPNGLDCVVGAKVSRSEVSSMLRNKFSVGNFWWNRPHTSFLGLIGYMVRSGQSYSGRELCSILPQKPSRIRFSKKQVFGLNFCTKSHLTYFPGQTD